MIWGKTRGEIWPILRGSRTPGREDAVPGPVSPFRSAERHSGGLECWSAFGLLSCPYKALVAFDLVAAAMHFLKVAQIRRTSAAAHGNDLVI